MLKTRKSRFVLSSIYLAAALMVTFAALRAGEDRSPGQADSSNTPLAKAATDMCSAAQAWWASLSPEEQAKAHFDFNNENRYDWHFIPRERKGLPYKEMNSAQRALAVAFLASGLSTRGLIQAETIMSLDQILKEMEPGPPKTPYRDPENYSFTLFGSPASKGAWGWRVEGHHLSINFTIVDGMAVAGGPVFLGTNPAEVREGPRKGLRVLAVEDDMGHELIRMLNDDQRKKTIIEAAAPKEVITGNSRKANPGPPAGIALSEMTAPQKKLAMALVEHYAHRLRSELANEDLARIEKAGWDQVHFAWAGGTEDGQGHYYRLHGPTFLVEFDDVQNNANHVHTVWRDAANDFGEDLLKAHYEAHPH